MKNVTYSLLALLMLIVESTMSTFAQGGNTSTSIPAVVKVYTDGGSTFTTNTVDLKNGATSATLHAGVYDQNGALMTGRVISLNVVNTPDATLGANKVNSGETTTLQFNGALGRTTIEATDETSGIKGHCYISAYNSDDNIAISNKGKDANGNEQSHTVSALFQSTGNIIDCIGNPDRLWKSEIGEQAEFTLDLGAYFDIDLVQVLFADGDFTDNYNIFFSKDNNNWTTGYSFPNDGISNQQDNVRVDAFNNNAPYLKGYRYVKFLSSDPTLTIKDFQIFGTYLAATIDDNTLPTVTASVDDESITVDNAEKTASATIKLNGSDDKAANLTYILKDESGLEYTTTGAPGSDINYNFTTLKPGTSYNFTVQASDGYNLSEPATVTFKTLSLDNAPEIDAVTATPTRNSVTISVTASNESEGDITVVLLNKNGEIIGQQTVTTTQNETSGMYEGTASINVAGLLEATEYTYFLRAYNGTYFSEDQKVTITTQSGPLVVTFTDGSGEHSNIQGNTGKLKELIEGCDDGDKDIKTVTALTVVSGNLNGADIATLRQMAQGNDYIVDDPAPTKSLADAGFSNPEGWVQGTLETLDLSNAGFKASNDVYITVHEYNDGSKTYTTDYYNTVDGEDLPNHAFSYCKSLKTVTLPTTVVPTAAFYNNINLEKVTVKGNQKVTSVGIRAFENCDKLTSLTSDDNIIDLSEVTGENLGSYAFHRCDGFTEVKLSPDLETIPGYCFQECSKLTTMNLSDAKKLKFIGYRAFCDSHKFILGNEGGNPGEYRVPNTVTYIGDYAFANIEVKKVWLPKNPDYKIVHVGLLGWNSREGDEQYSLERVWIPNNVTTIDGNAFASCHDLTDLKDSIEAGTHITEIGGSAFVDNWSMTDADLTRLLQDITVVNGSTFEGCTSLTKIDLNDAKNGITTVWGSGFARCTSVTDINLGTVQRLEDLAFAYNTAVTNITVNTAKAPSTPAELQTTDYLGNIATHDPFANIPSNQVTITFSGDVDKYDASRATGYMSYRANNAFMRLLTKHLDENNEADYNVAGQKHADVTLQRTFKAGYNTLALPFGAPSDDNHAVKNARVFANALFTGSSDHGKISVYRGLRDNNVFMFLKYTNLDTDPIEDFEPVMAFMTQTDINYAKVSGGVSNNGVTTDYFDLKTLTDGEQYYKFVDVDVNGYNGTICKPNALPGFVDSNGNKFTGVNKDHDMAWFSKTTGDYAFVGTYKNSNSVMHTGDYFIQTKDDGKTYFYEVVDGKTYRVKGFRGWFTPSTTSTTGGAKPSVMSVDVVDEAGSGETTDINTIEANDYGIEKANIYNMNGQLVRKDAVSLDGLPKGIYIMNGKKIIVK